MTTGKSSTHRSRRGCPPASSVPPSTATRSRIPISPCPRSSRRAVSSTTDTTSHRGRRLKRRRARPACFNTLVNLLHGAMRGESGDLVDVGVARARERDVHARMPHRVDQVVDRVESRLRCDTTLGSQHAEQPPQLGERGACGVGDVGHRLPLALGLRLQHRLRTFGLHRDDAHVVRDDVVQVARDRETLGQRDTARIVESPRFHPGCALSLRAYRVAEEPRGDPRQVADGDIGCIGRVSEGKGEHGTDDDGYQDGRIHARVGSGDGVQRQRPKQQRRVWFGANAVPRGDAADAKRHR